jgi:hypothetical protein
MACPQSGDLLPRSRDSLNVLPEQLLIDRRIKQIFSVRLRGKNGLHCCISSPHQISAILVKSQCVQWLLGLSLMIHFLLSLTLQLILSVLQATCHGRGSNCEEHATSEKVAQVWADAGYHG